ncbi:MAG TPA: phytanoyl-CoA dioxygenase family protein [Rhizomicrobium sp.]|nr:phytanoyl-CoA dioxygenase family protein [Rhizomicrobium sp.]
MEIGDWTSSAEVNDIYRQARTLGLESNLLELEVYGFTIIEPEKVGIDLTKRMTTAIYDLIHGEASDHVPLNTYKNSNVDGRHLFHLLLKNPVFVEGMMNPVVMTLARFSTGMKGKLNATVSFVKHGAANPTKLHCDATNVTAPMPPYGHFINISYVLTDYNVPNGTLAIVPGSNRWCRPPTPIEQPKCLGGVNDDICIPIIAKAGSIVAFNGNTWHGAYPKTSNEDRIHVSYGFARPYVMPGENYDDIPDSMAEQYGPEFAQLVGKYEWQGWRSDGPRFERAEAGEIARLAARKQASA